MFLPKDCTKRRNCIARVTLFAVVSVAMAAGCFGQELSLIDLTKVTAHRDLRRPEAGSVPTTQRGGVGQTVSCLDPTQSTGKLETSLVSLDHTQYQDADKPTFEVTIENAGSTPIRVPVSPHLADLQSKNPGEKFAYSKMQITLWRSSVGGSVNLYGTEGHTNTTLTLKPGEWLRVIGKGHIDLNGRVKQDILVNPVDQMSATTSVFKTKL